MMVRSRVTFGVVSIAVALQSSILAMTPSTCLTVAALQTDAPFEVVNGRLHPELIPEHVVWETFFHHMVAVAFDHPDDAEPNAKYVEALSRYNLLIPREQVTTVLQVAKGALAKVAELYRPLEQEHEGKVHLAWTKEQRLAVKTAMEATITSARDELVSKLSKEDMAAVDSYVRTKVVPGITWSPGGPPR